MSKCLHQTSKYMEEYLVKGMVYSEIPQNTIFILILLNNVLMIWMKILKAFFFTFVYDMKLYLKYLMEARFVELYPK